MTPDSAREDLAFIRALISPEDRWQQQFGKIYAAVGACYSVEMVGHAAQFLHLAPSDGIGAQVIGWAPTVVVLLIIIWFIRSQKPTLGGGTTSRAVGAVFGAVGLTNLALCLSIGSVALRLHSQTIWLLYPCIVMILQGMAWLVAYMLRRKAWLLGVAFGWLAVGVAMAVCIENMLGYVIAASVGVVCFMLIPGLYIMRQGGRSA